MLSFVYLNKFDTFFNNILLLDPFLKQLKINVEKSAYN